MRSKEDLRVIKTKKALSEAFVRLLGKKPLDEITINELCEEAGVRRATFYKHYSDKFNFLTEYTKSLRSVFERTVWKSDKPGATKDYYVEYARRLILFIRDHSVEIDNVLTSPLFPSALNIVIEQNYHDTYERLKYSQSKGLKLNASVEVTASMCTGAVAQTVYRWLINGKQTDAEELAVEIGRIISAVIGSNQS
jgi:AcrR family transcriptional regulator